MKAITQSAPPVLANGRSQELRLALSMRGGVSLAVWIGGALAEVDRFGRAGKTPDDHIAGLYRQILDRTGYSDVVIDVLTGASAGGLNGVIYAASKVYGFDFDEMLPVWVQLGDIEQLGRATVGVDDRAALRTPRPPSLLRGDDYFQTKLRDELKVRIDEALARDQADPTACIPRTDPLELILSATLVNPTAEVRTDDPYSPIVELRRSASFHFRYPGTRHHTAGSFRFDDKATATDDAASTVNLLALAGRATSSFPVAFEPATIPSVAAEVFSDCDRDRAVQVLDGGVLDNIPVAKAIEAIAAAPASGPTERWLLFLHPSPSDGHAGQDLPAATSPRAVKTLVQTAAAMFSQESLLSDLDELAQYNQEADRQALRRDAIVEPFASCKDDVVASAVIEAARGHGGGVRRSALARQAEIDADRVARLIRADRRAEKEITPDTIAELLREWYEADESAAFRAGDSLALTTEQLLNWTRDLQGRIRDDRALDLLGRAKHYLYRLRQVATRLAELSDFVWTEAARHEDDAPTRGWVATTIGLATQVVTRAPKDETARLVTALGLDHQDPPRLDGSCIPTIDDTALLDATEAFDAKVRSRARTEHLVEDGANLGELLWQGLVRCGRCIDQAIDVADHASDKVVFRVLENAGEHLDDALDALLVLLTPLQASTIASDNIISFLRVSGNSVSPLAPLLSPGKPFGVAEKLCGNDLVNFAAFFSARWRANDWMWGRLDAAKSLIDMTVRSDRLATFGGGRQALRDFLRDTAAQASCPMDSDRWHDIDVELDDLTTAPDKVLGIPTIKALLVEALQRHIMCDLVPRVLALDEHPNWAAAEAAEPLEPQKLDAALAHYRVGAESLATLDPKRRTRIGMRLSMVGFRALQPDTDSLKSRGARVVMRLFKPLYLYSSFAALSLPRALALVMMSAAGWLVGPWRYRVKDGFAWTKVLMAGGDARWQPSMMWDAGVLPIVAALTVLVIAAIAAQRLWRAKTRGVLRWQHPNTRWYMGTLLTALVCLVMNTSTVRIGPPVVVVGAAFIAYLSSNWMERPARWVTTGVTGLGYAIAAGGCVVLARVQHASTDAYTAWWALFGLYAAVNLISMVCSYLPVLPRRAEARTRVTAAFRPAAGAGRA